MANYNSIKNAALIAPTTNPDLGSASNRYGNVYLSGNVNIAGTSITSTNALTPKVSSIGYIGDDTAADIAGGQTITLNGSGFVFGASVLIGGTVVGVVTFISSNQLTLTSPAMSAGSYVIYVINPDGGTAMSLPGIQYSGTPSWTTTAGALTGVVASASVSITLAATGDAPVTYSLYSGTLPSGVTLNSATGALSGTAPAVTNSTLYSFTIRATDAQKQDTNRSFSLTVAASVTIEYLVIGKGGDGSWGGGGAGGFISGTATVAPGDTRVITFNNAASYSGGKVIFGSLVAINGGDEGQAGGSGGGGSINQGSTPTGAPKASGLIGGAALQPASASGGLGYAGADAPVANSSTKGGGGGGGAGGPAEVRYTWSSNSGGAGGAGVTSNITGVTISYAGGGGGGQTGATPAGGGGASYGGGGSMTVYNPQYTGGPGVVVIAYPSSTPAITTIPGTLTYAVDTTTRTGYRVYTFTAGTGTITF